MALEIEFSSRISMNVFVLYHCFRFLSLGRDQYTYISNACWKEENAHESNSFHFNFSNIIFIDLFIYLFFIDIF